ncbi:hypothetical protein AVL62_07085 [Serinicoccus chungangensis]|uniref:DUF72 domain-containing protein n=1 Tax=Serinicoccus chungangensis TaxID=767452 RepID=A0A0W8IHW3_9MICO|nr:DUF72 domain-containing protein [Serinicoccus chungangensis]KUG59427.1 hypothetical protein AVL62_07085 [Serinicoccus chungangensis]
MGTVRVGISGWRYRPWRGEFYPPGLVQRRELEYAAQRFSTIELNGSFYSLQRPESYRQWAEQTPEGFVFGVKGSRFITHLKSLGDVDQGLANFWASGVLALGPRLGPVLWQLPARHRYDREQLRDFLSRLPRTTAAALDVARGHDDRVADRTWLQIDADRPLEHVLEVRHHDSFAGNLEFLELLREQRVGVVVADSAGLWPFFDAVTSPVVYVRLHGDSELYVSGYSDEALQTWAGRVERWREEADVYVYLDNDVKVRAPYDAARLAGLLGVDVPPP